ncbi:MAG: hypothetical protein ACLQU3_29475 [Limisphaerales bacterium]
MRIAANLGEKGTKALKIVGHGSAWVPMGCAEIFVLRLPDNYHPAARDALRSLLPYRVRVPP